MDRRSFLKVCTTVALTSPPLLYGVLRAGESEFKPYKKALLVNKDGKPVTPEEIKPSKEYIFFYPYRSTPCLLINLGRRADPVEVETKDGHTYLWRGGVGPDRSIVAFSAICTHQLSHPTPSTTFINYYPEGKKAKIAKRDLVIQCCAHMSAFDPAKGGKVIEGPAPFPLTAIVLSYEQGKIYALGTLGKEVYEDFFDVFKPDLRKLYGSSRKARELVDVCTVLEMEEYTEEIVRC
ncbi:MAG: Rieske 2Fe-2S domain-containing protein [Aquificota bacterium]|nr:Rieske 2Fe-2S domain-containing protein [Aquificota bacterium]